MDQVTIERILTFVAGGLTTGAAVWVVSTIADLRRRVADLLRRDEVRRDAEHADAEKLAALQAANAQLKAANEDLSRRAWPGSLNLDQRAWLASITGLQEVAAQDQLDALMRLSPEAVQRVVSKIAPHLFSGKVG